MTAVPPNSESRAYFIATQSDAIVIARLVRKTPQFVQRKFLQNTPAAVAQANWIISLVEARVERVIKESRDLALGAGTPLVFEEDSAVATIGDTRVETRIGDCTGAPATILLTCAHVWA